MKRRVAVLHSGLFWAGIWGAGLLFAAVLIPGLLVGTSGSSPVAPVLDSPPSSREAAPVLTVPVYLSGEQRTERVPLEAYVLGVVAAEMPVNFQLEALKAQALAARTYIVLRMLEQGGLPDPAAESALVTDTVQHQAYTPPARLKEKWGSDYEGNMNKLSHAVRETEGQVLVHNGRPINATFFSTSNGYTENSEDYWQEKVPYLRSVASPWDQALSPKYKGTLELSAKDFLKAMGLPAAVPVSTASGMRIVDTTAGHRVKRIVIGGQPFTGRQVREKLSLPSSQFEWTVRAGRITFTTYGYGHGVGMSQWGAEGMARQGSSAEQIVKHYYTGIEIAPLSSVL